tara:strand:+ start:194 stop:784 length:591 start_codon:yes stop_codon:yes gene_type:complete
MKNRMNKRCLIIGVFAVIIFMASCTGDSNPGYEYMPNMYRSPSLETYGVNNINTMNARIPVDGTIARGHLSTFNYNSSLDGYLSAGNKVINPVEKTEDNLADGRELFGMFCKHCHGIKGAGDGTIKHAIYSAVPAYNDNEMIRRSGTTMKNLKEGHIFHTITFGLNAMGPHATQLSHEERWKIVLYVKELQKFDNK